MISIQLRVGLIEGLLTTSQALSLATPGDTSFTPSLRRRAIFFQLTPLVELILQIPTGGRTRQLRHFPTQTGLPLQHVYLYGEPDALDPS
jgi:hypothetical protein